MPKNLRQTPNLHTHLTHRFVCGALGLLCVLVLTAGCGGENKDQALDNGLAAYENRDYAAARKHFKRLTKLMPDSYAASFNLGMSCFNLEDFDAAADAFKRANILSPDANNIDALEGLARSLRRAGDPDAAMITYGIAENKIGRTPIIIAGMAQCQIDKGNPVIAVDILEEALANFKDDPVVLFNLGVLLAKPSTTVYNPVKSATCLYRFLSVHRNNQTFSEETHRAAQTLAMLSRTSTAELQDVVFDKIMEAERHPNARERYNISIKALIANPASPEALNACIKHARKLGGDHIRIAENLQEIYDLVHSK